MPRLNFYILSHSLITTVFFGLILTGCATDENKNHAPGELPAQSTPPAPPVDELTPISPNVVYSTGWGEMTVNANYAKTTITLGAHFATNRNACGKDAYGSIDLELWNALAKNTNLAIQGGTRTEMNCVDPPTETYKFMDGTVEVKLAQGTRTLYELKNGQICSSIQDKVVSDALLRAINQLIVVADKEDCPNGWGS